MNRPTRLLIACALIAAAGTGAYLIRSEKPAPQASSTPKSRIRNSKSPILPLHPVVGKIVREGRETPYLKFNYLIKELPVDLADHDIHALIGFISSPRPPKFQDAEWGSLVNDIEECLTVQSVPKPVVADALIAIHRDESRIQLQRDYALQHIGGFAIYLVHTGAAASPLLPRLISELQLAASDGSKPWAGTAFNLLDGLLRAAEYRAVEVPGLNADSLVKMAIPIARDPAAPLNARLPALQLASRHGSPEALSLARDILADPASSLMLVQSAAAVTGRLGGPDDIPLLERQLASNNHHARAALVAAIQLIRKP